MTANVVEVDLELLFNSMTTNTWKQKEKKSIGLGIQTKHAHRIADLSVQFSSVHLEHNQQVASQAND